MCQYAYHHYVCVCVCVCVCLHAMYVQRATCTYVESCITFTWCKAFSKQKEIHACEINFFFEGLYVTYLSIQVFCGELDIWAILHSS